MTRSRLTMALVVVLGLVASIGLTAGGAANAAKAKRTYAYTSQYYKGFGYTDSTIGVRKPKSLAAAGSSYVFIESKSAKPGHWKGWGSKRATVRPKKQRICPDGQPCSESKKGKLILSKRTKMTCTVKGKSMSVWLYRTIKAKNPKSKAFPEGQTLKVTYPAVCPSEF